MIHSYEHTTYFREAEQDGYIGARGYFGYFQDGVTGLLNLVDKGNVTLVEKYRAPWIFLRYRMHFVREIGYDHRVRVESWCEKRPSKRTLWLDTTISVEGERVGIWEKTDEANPQRHILLVTHEDGQPAAQCALYVEPRHR